jgi:hypothetical protein
MNASTTIIAGGRNQQHPPLAATRQSLTQMCLGLVGPGLLARTDVDDGDVAFERESDRARQIDLGRRPDLAVGAPAKEYRENKAGAFRRNSSEGFAVSKDQAADAGAVRIGTRNVRRHHGVENFDGSRAKRGMGQVGKPVDDADQDLRRTSGYSGEGRPDGGQSIAIVGLYLGHDSIIGCAALCVERLF